MNDISSRSEEVFVGLCIEIGTPSKVRIRREVGEIKDAVNNLLWASKGVESMTNGSEREGIRQATSDMDIMIMIPNHKVICNVYQISLYQTRRQTIILMECEDAPPGYSRLRLMTPSVDKRVIFSLILINDGMYVSSSRFHSDCSNWFQNNNVPYVSVRKHGPCAFINHPMQKFDYAFCFRSHHWPIVALPWIRRCREKRWPPECVISSIIKIGCHVVPIGSSPFHSGNDIEWRISFSMAEHRLIFSMNHCQLLCYCLMKIFFKEVINKNGHDDEDPSICSYFLKTVVFWVIQNNNYLQWIPCNLLTCSWTCFKLLIFWVYKGECPNFFIPQNNMFRGKIVGHIQATLFDKLNDLYCKGISCLLSCPSVANFLNYLKMQRLSVERSCGMQVKTTVSTNESIIMSDVKLEKYLYLQLSAITLLMRENKKEFVRSFTLLERISNAHLTPYQEIAVQVYFSSWLRRFAWVVINPNMPNISNKWRAYFSNKACNIMRLSCKIGFASDILYVAMYYYRDCRYEQSLKCLQRAEKRMSEPYVIYRSSRLDEEMYRRAMAGLSLGAKMRKSVMTEIFLQDTNTYITELALEQRYNIFISPLVMLHFLSVLNHHKLGDTIRARKNKNELQNLLLGKGGKFDIPLEMRDISWHILGICQQTIGDDKGAFKSYQLSLAEPSYRNARKATIARIAIILFRLFSEKP